MIAKEKEAEVLRLYHGEKWPVGTIAAQLGLHHTTVQRVLGQASVDPKVVAPRPSMVDPFVPFIVEQLGKYPSLRSSRLFGMLKERGYPGGPDHLRRVIGRLRPKKPAEAFQRLRTLPGEQAQVDWAHFGKLAVGRALRPLWAFVMVLSYSRRIFLRFFPSAAMPFFVRGHVEAFADIDGVPRVLLYDNLKSAVVERHGDAIRFHPMLLALSAHYRFEPRPVAVARGNEKGRVERAIRYVREAFFVARTYADLDDLNRQATEWTSSAALDRSWVEDRARTVRQAFDDERSVLLSLPDTPFPAHERVEVEVLKNVAHQAVVRGHTVRFSTASDMLADLAAQESSAALARRLHRYTVPALLCIDEVGYLSYDGRYADLLFEVVTRRYDAQKPILLSTNKAFSDWGQVFPHAACVVTLVDRLVHRAEVIEIEAESYRLKEAKELSASRIKQRRAKKH